MQNVIADSRAVVICDRCGTEYPSKSGYDKKRPVPQDIYVPDDFEVIEGLEYCAKCAKAIHERDAEALKELREP